MDLPPTSSNERRAVPRHMRDGEHHEWNEATTAEGRARLRQLAPWILLAVAIAGIAAWWLYQGRA